MEGDLPSSDEELRDLYCQSHQLSSQLWVTVFAIQCKLDSVVPGQASQIFHRCL
jgi:hypothetical protein